MREALRCAVVMTAVAHLGLLGLGGCVAPRGAAQPPGPAVPPEKIERLLNEPCGVVSVVTPFRDATFGDDGRSIDVDLCERPASGVLVGKRSLLVTHHQIDESEDHILIDDQRTRYRVARTMPEPIYADGWALLIGNSDPVGWALLTLSTAPRGVEPIQVDGLTALPDGGTIFIVFSELVNAEDAQQAFEESRFDILTFRRRVAVGRAVQRKPRWLRRWIEANPQRRLALSGWLLVLGLPKLTPGTSGAAAFWWPDGSEDPICVGVAEAGVEFRDHRTGQLLDSGGLIRRPRQTFCDSVDQVAPDTDNRGVEP